MKYYLCTFNTFNMHLFSLDFNTLNIMFQVSILQNSKIFFYVHNQNSSLENMVKVYYKTNKRDKKGKNRSSRVSGLKLDFHSPNSFTRSKKEDILYWLEAT